MIDQLIEKYRKLRESAIIEGERCTNANIRSYRNGQQATYTEIIQDLEALDVENVDTKNVDRER